MIDMIKERWILNGSFVNGDKFQETFDSIFEMTDEIDNIYTDWLSSLNLIDPSECINPFSLSFENDNTKEEVNHFLDLS